MSGYFTQGVSGCFGFAGALDDGVYQQYLQALAPALAAIQKRECPQTRALLDLSKQKNDLENIAVLAETIGKRFKHVVVCGSGGSGLSGRIFAQLKPPSIDMHFLENIDPDLIQALLARIDIKHSCFIIISKSGTTVETLCQFYLLVEKLQQHGGSPAEQCIVITMQGDSHLKQAAAEHKMKWLAHPANIGGRFSALTVVGLLPAALCGLAIGALREGAQSVVDALDHSADVGACIPAQGAALHAAAIQSGRNISVMWPYGERLAGFASWYRQSWAESLGKSGKGSTPLVAMGSTDQHSQLQLFLDGPKDKLFHLITLDRAQQGPVIPAPRSLPHLAGKTLGDVMQAQQEATYTTLIQHGCPVRRLALAALDEKTFGALLMQGMLEILFMAKLLNISPFDQPAVEESKKLARASLLGEAA